jgi:hypothetical protein
MLQVVIGIKVFKPTVELSRPNSPTQLEKVLATTALSIEPIVSVLVLGTRVLADLLKKLVSVETDLALITLQLDEVVSASFKISPEPFTEAESKTSVSLIFIPLTKFVFWFTFRYC